MHVESVAWISQRKDVLSIALGLAAAWWYVRYVKTGEYRRLVMCTLFAALAMMAKPTLVTLPLMLLLLDGWPLHRLGRKAMLEKLPLFALAAAVCVMTYHAQAQGGAMNAGAELTASQRLAGGIVAYGQYLAKTVWPTNLSVHYAHPYLPGGGGLAWWQIAASAAILLTITGIVIAQRRQRHLLFGWLWFVIALLPVIGIVHVGDRLIADRYTTWAHIGLFIAIVETARRIELPHRLGGVVAACLLAACGYMAFEQASCWRDSTSLYAHSLRSQPNSPLLHNNYGLALKGAGHVDEAERHYRRAIELNPADPLAHHNLANVLADRGESLAARDHYRAAVEAQPRMDAALFALARVSLELNDLPTAIDACRRVIALQPDLPAPHALMNNILLAAGDPDGAAIHRRRAIELDMSYADMAAVATP
jgi:Flp pilus assembly protein TadD